MGELLVRRLEKDDFDAWRALFSSYLDFYRESLEDQVVSESFERLIEDNGPLFGLIAVAGDGGDAVGIVDCVLHLSTWSKSPTCYLEDLFVEKEARGTKAARALIKAAKQEAARRGADRIYWHTQSFNGPARSLYDQVARLSSFVVYEQEL